MVSRHRQPERVGFDEQENDAHCCGNAEFKKTSTEPPQTEAGVKVRFSEAVANLFQPRIDLLQIGTTTMSYPGLTRD